MSFFGLFKSDEEKRADEIASVKKSQAHWLGQHGGGAGLDDHALRILDVAAHTTANHIGKLRKPKYEQIMNIVHGAWTAEVQWQAADDAQVPHAASKLYQKIVAPVVRDKLGRDLGYAEMYAEEAEKPAGAPATAPAAPPSPSEPPAPAPPKHHHRSSKPANIDHDAEGSVDAEDLAQIAAEHPHRHHR